MKNKSKNASTSFLTLIVLPLVLGLVIYGVLISMINGDVIQNEMAVRYLTGHPVSLFTTAMFCIGVAALLLVGKSVLDQNWLRKKITLAAAEQTEDWDTLEDSARASACQDTLLLMPKRFREFFLWNRLFESLDFLRRNETNENLDDELKYLAEGDLDRQPDRFALVRILIWATPMLGFLGTVLGISQALGSINVGADNDFQQMLGGLRESLYVAFDTTALALTFSIVLMFGQFVIDRFDTQLLAGVDDDCRSELEKYFEMTVGRKDPETRLLEKVGRQISGAVEHASQNQIEVWSESMLQANEQWRENARELNQQWNDTHQQIVRENHWETMHEHWETIQSKWKNVHDELLNRWDELDQGREKAWQQSGAQMQKGVGDALERACVQIQTGISQQLVEAGEQMDRRWQQLQVAMSDQARLVQAQQEEMQAQAESLSDTIREIAGTLETLRPGAANETNQVAFENQAALTEAILSLRDTVSQQDESRESSEQSHTIRLADVVEQLGAVVSELKPAEPAANNQELKLRIIRPAA